MRRRLTALICAPLICGPAAICACTGLASARQAHSTGRSTHRHAPANLLINAQEWSLWPSRGSVPAGTVYVELWNRGQDLHDTKIRRVNAAGKMVGPVEGSVKATMPGHISEATWHLKPGHYELYCGMPGHIELGMHAKLTVARP